MFSSSRLLIHRTRMLLAACFIYNILIDTCHSEDASNVNTVEIRDTIYLACVNGEGFCKNNGTCLESFNGPIVIFCRCKEPFFGDRCHKEDTKECDQMLFGVGILAGIAIIIAVGSTCQLYLKSGDIKQAKIFYQQLERQSQRNNSSPNRLPGRPEHELQYIKHQAIDIEDGTSMHLDLQAKLESDAYINASDLDSMNQNIEIPKPLQSSSSLHSPSKSATTEDKNTIGVEIKNCENESVFVDMVQEEKISNNVSMENPSPAKGKQDIEKKEQKWNSKVTDVYNNIIPQVVVAEDEKNFAMPDEIVYIENREHFDLETVIENKDEMKTAPIATVDQDDATNGIKSHFRQLQSEGQIERNYSRIPGVSRTQKNDIPVRGQRSPSIRIRGSNYNMMKNEGLDFRSRKQSFNRHGHLERHSSIRSLDDMIDHPFDDIYAHSVPNSMEKLSTYEYPVHNNNGNTSRNKYKTLEVPVSYTIDNSGNISPTFHPYIANNRNKQRRSYSVRSNASYHSRPDNSNVKYMSMNTHFANRRRSESLHGSTTSSSYDNRPKGIWARSMMDLDKLSRYSIY